MFDLRHSFHSELEVLMEADAPSPCSFRLSLYFGGIEQDMCECLSADMTVTRWPKRIRSTSPLRLKSRTDTDHHGHRLDSASSWSAHS